MCFKFKYSAKFFWLVREKIWNFILILSGHWRCSIFYIWSISVLEWSSFKQFTGFSLIRYFIILRERLVTECIKYPCSFVTLVLCLRFLLPTSAEKHEIHVNNIQQFRTCLILKLIHLHDKDHSKLFMEISAVCSDPYIQHICKHCALKG